MGSLRHIATGRTFRLCPRSLVGRAPRCDVRLSDRRVSGEHAVILWDGGWAVRDLGSSNGTFVRGQRLEPGQVVPLQREDLVAFGDEGGHWALADDWPPAVMARAGDLVVAGEGDLLALPPGEEPELCVFRDGQGQWIAEGAGSVEPVCDGQLLDAGGRSWSLTLPEVLPRTWEGAPLALDRVGLRFEVSRDEEHVRAWLLSREGEVDLGARAHHYLLLTLARARLADAGELTASSAGWLYQEELASRLDMDQGLLHLHVFRARRQLAEVGIQGAGMLVERRVGAGQLRIGVASLEVRTV